MDAATRTRLEANLADLKAKRDKLSAALDAALENSEVESYSLTDPEGGQTVKRRDPAALMDQIHKLDRHIDYLEARIANRPGRIHFGRW